MLYKYLCPIQHFAAIFFLKSASKKSVMEERAEPLTLAPPFDERIYSIKRVAEILDISENQATKRFENEPGVRDLSGARYFGKRKRMLRIPHSVLVRVWNRSEISPKSSLRRLQ